MKTQISSKPRHRATRIVTLLVAQLAALSLVMVVPVGDAQARSSKSKKSKSRPANSSSSSSNNGNHSNNGNNGNRGNSGNRGNGNAYGQRGQTPRGNAYGQRGQTPRGNAVGQRGQAPRGNARGQVSRSNSPQRRGQVTTRSSHGPRRSAQVSTCRSNCRGVRSYQSSPRYRSNVAYRTYHQPRYVVTGGHTTTYVNTAPRERVVTNVYRNPYQDRFDLGLGLGGVFATPQLQSGLPMVNGKLRMLGQVTDRLGLGIDLDMSSMVFVNHATANAVVSFDMLADPEMALRPYMSLGGGALHVYEDGQHFLGPAVSARAGIELKPISWLGLALEGGGVAGADDGNTMVVPYVGGTLSLYLL